MQAVSLTLTDTNRPKPRSTDSIGSFLREIGQISLLSNTEEICLSRRVQAMMALKAIEARLVEQNGAAPSLEDWATAAGVTPDELNRQIKSGNAAKHRMIEANLRLVVMVAKKYRHSRIELSDLIQEGAIGLERAVEKFDATKGFKFSTYAYWWIRQGITRAIADQSRLIRLPVHINEVIGKIKRAQRELNASLGRAPRVDEIAHRLTLSTDEVKHYLKMDSPLLSLDMRIGEDQTSDLQDFIESDEAAPEDNINQSLLRSDLFSLIDELPPAQQEVIKLRFGFYDGEPLTLQQAGDRMNLSRERIRQLQQSAMKHLRFRQSKVKTYL